MKIGNLTLFKFLKVIVGLRLVDPIEVYYVIDKNLFYPIISKSGCSTVKRDLIRLYNPGFISKFPEIHQVDPAIETQEKIIRRYFYSLKKYHAFCKGKRMCIVIRNPYERAYSCYLDIKKGKNIMYEDPSGLTNLFKFKREIAFEKFIRKIIKTPDRLSDRHFRSQNFYAKKEARNVISEFNVVLLESYNKSISLANKLNANNKKIPLEVLEELKGNEKFNKRFRQDIQLYNSYQ